MADKRKTGHRQRLRDRFLAGDTESRFDEVLLELLLSFAIGRKDVKPLAEELIRIFGSLSQVLSTTKDDLGKVKGIGQSSIALLKLVEFIRAENRSIETMPLRSKVVPEATQQKLFENLPDEQITDDASITGDSVSKTPNMADGSIIPLDSARTSNKKTKAGKSIRRKFQVSRSHVLEFNHFARILSFLYDNRREKRISRHLLIKNSGLPDGQVASLISIGASMGLIQAGGQILTPTGLMIAEHDIFFENQGTLEWCHYKGAGSYQNLVWFEIFNHLLVEEAAATPNLPLYFSASANRDAMRLESGAVKKIPQCGVN